jgi:uncharacterized membrane protein
MSLLPFSTSWMAVSKLSPQPVAFYAATFFLVNATYFTLVCELIGTSSPGIASKVRAIMHARSLISLFVFAAAAFIALKYPVTGLSMCIGCLVFYLRPEPPWALDSAGDEADSEDS